MSDVSLIPDGPPPGLRPFLSFSEVVAQSLGDITGLSVVDIGCGSGAATRMLTALGATATGVEPNPAVLAVAEAAGGASTYVCSGAEATGLSAGAFDIALFTRSLHHVPDMDAALAEARRIVKPRGRIGVLEPQAPDPLTPLMKLIDDETEVYAAAQAALERCGAGGGVERRPTLFYATKWRGTNTAQHVIDAMLAVDGARRFDEADRPAFEAAFAAAKQEDAEGVYLITWERMDVLALS